MKEEFTYNPDVNRVHIKTPRGSNQRFLYHGIDVEDFIFLVRAYRAAEEDYQAAIDNADDDNAWRMENILREMRDGIDKELLKVEEL